tara:strand:- start:234 stop:533 length:300 start_codon:yes stop_codon:yes gene_type:complete
MTEHIKTKFGVIRKKIDGTYNGYVNHGDNYFNVKEEDVLIDYIDLGFIVQHNEYILKGGSSIKYTYRWKDSDGMVNEEPVVSIVHPTMVMRTNLVKVGA